MTLFIHNDTTDTIRLSIVTYFNGWQQVEDTRGFVIKAENDWSDVGRPQVAIYIYYERRTNKYRKKIDIE